MEKSHEEELKKLYTVLETVLPKSLLGDPGAILLLIRTLERYLGLLGVKEND